MERINKIKNFYKKENISEKELEYIEIGYKYLEWKFMTDEDKLKEREGYLLISDKLDNEINTIELQYEKVSLLTLKFILNFLKNTQNEFEKYDQFKNAQKIFFRIYNLIFIEKELLLFSRSIRGTKIHIPYEIFEPLIEKVKDTEEYKLYKLDELFVEYRKMYQLFLEKPYEEKSL